MKTKSIEQKREFIEMNMSYVPVNCLAAFNALPIEKQYNRMRDYVSRAKRKDNPTLCDYVKMHVKSKRANTQEILKVAQFLNSWINDINKRKASDIEKQIAKLQLELKEVKAQIIA